MQSRIRLKFHLKKDQYFWEDQNNIMPVPDYTIPKTMLEHG